ncbi:peptide transporter [Escherichia coli]|uniref:Plasmid partition protein n=1 Tax=Salmonella enterica I TaxID=59201 RepID=A0A379Y265_SALET|nr:peptide transporter [Escherichia coli]EHS0389581.1 peptide transporter [Salmonella enterica]SUI39815.1 plasmid partition protein [Salmonella enterica subsp. enterica]
MSDEQHIGNDKSRYLNAPKRTEVSHRSGLPSLKSQPRLRKLFTLHNGRKLEAEHIIVPAERVKLETAVHPMNPRNQEALTLNAVRDILEQIQARGVDTEGVAVKRNGVYLLIEGSRRRFCCIHLAKDLPLWVLPDELSPEDINSIITAAQTSRRFSYREVGFQYLQKMEEHGFVTNEELANFLGISHVSVSKRVQAAKIDNSLIALFPDYEGIPNSYYNRLSRLQKYIEKNLYSLEEVVESVREETKSLDVTDISEAQKSVIDKITKVVERLDINPPSKGWDTRELALFDNKDKYARVSKNASGRKIRFEFNRMNSELIAEIEEFIKLKLKEK